MPKRVSLQGKGADIFFGEYSSTPPQDTTAENQEMPDIAPNQPSADTTQDSTVVTLEDQGPSTQESMHARMREGLQDNTNESKNVSMQETRRQHKKPTNQHASSPLHASATPLSQDVLISIWDDVTERATITNAFRYTDQELSQLTDVIYDITKRHTVKLSKQDIARLALNAVLWDYRERGDKSLLGEFALRKKRRRGGD